MSNPLRHGQPWTDTEIQQLLQYVKKDYALSKIASEHQRSTGSIRAKLKQLAADYYFNDNRPIDEIIKFTGLDAETIADAISKRQWEIDQKEKKEKESVQLSYSSVKPTAEVKREYMTSVLVEIRDMMKEMLEIMKAERSHK